MLRTWEYYLICALPGLVVLVFFVRAESEYCPPGGCAANFHDADASILGADLGLLQTRLQKESATGTIQRLDHSDSAWNIHTSGRAPDHQEADATYVVRQAHDDRKASGRTPGHQEPCATGDDVKAVFAGDSNQYSAFIKTISAGSITVTWADGGTTHRVVDTDKVFKNGVACSNLQVGNLRSSEDKSRASDFGKVCADDRDWVDKKYGQGKAKCNGGADGGVAANPTWCKDYGDYSVEARRACPLACGICRKARGLCKHASSVITCDSGYILKRSNTAYCAGATCRVSDKNFCCEARITDADIKGGYLVTLASEESAFKFAFNGTKYSWDDSMRRILGTEQHVVESASGGVFGLEEAKKGSGHKIWYYPIGVVTSVKDNINRSRIKADLQKTILKLENEQVGSLETLKRELWQNIEVPASLECSNCDCLHNDWIGMQSILSCATTCAASGFTRFQHASGIKNDGTRGDDNCACCQIGGGNTPNDGTTGVNVYQIITRTAGSVWFATTADRNYELGNCTYDAGWTDPIHFGLPSTHPMESGTASCAALGLTCAEVIDWGCAIKACTDNAGVARAVRCNPGVQAPAWFATTFDRNDELTNCVSPAPIDFSLPSTHPMSSGTESCAALGMTCDQVIDWGCSIRPCSNGAGGATAVKCRPVSNQAPPSLVGANHDCAASNGWLGSQSLPNCAATCYAFGATHFQHASGIKNDGNRGDGNCACCTSMSTTANDGNAGVNVYQIMHTVAPVSLVGYNHDCAANGGWLGAQALSSCATTCAAVGATYFQHASGTKNDGNRGDNNCACCTTLGTTANNGDAGVNVYQILRTVMAISVSTGWISGGIGTACRLDESDTSTNGQLTTQLREGVTSTNDCKALCDSEEVCTGIEYDLAEERCELWTRRIGYLVSASGYECIRKEETSWKRHTVPDYLVKNYGVNPLDNYADYKAIDNLDINRCQSLIGTFNGFRSCQIKYAAFGNSNRCHTYCQYHRLATTNHGDTPIGGAWHLQEEQAFEQAGQGHCLHGQLYASSAWTLLSDGQTQTVKGFHTPEYAGWLAEAWRRCLEDYPATVYVSCWQDAGYRCYNHGTCDANGASNTRSWFLKARSYQMMPKGTTACPEGLRISSIMECDHAFFSIQAEESLTPGRVMQSGNWNGVPIDCSTQYTADQAPHWNIYTSTDNHRVSSGEFRIICKAEMECPSGTQQVGPHNADIAGCGLQACEDRYTAQSMEECKALCAGEPRCKAFTWAPLNGDQNQLFAKVCTLYDRDTHTSSWGPNQKMCKMVPYTCEKNKIYSSLETPENMPFSVTTGVQTESQCAALCDSTMDCNVYMYDRYGGCYLKTSWASTTDANAADHTVSCYKAKHYNCARNKNYMSQATPEDMPESVTSGVQSQSQCAALCDGTPGCKVYVHNNQGGCYLKTQWRTTVNDDPVHETVACYKAIPRDIGPMHCTEGAGGTCYTCTYGAAGGDCTNWATGYNAGYTNDYFGFQQYCKSWSANGGRFNGGCGPCGAGASCEAAPWEVSRPCEIFDNWRKNWGGSQVEITIGAVAYGTVVENWNTCLELCRNTPNCAQVVFVKSSRACYGMNAAEDSDQDNLGGTNNDFISAHCQATWRGPLRTAMPVDEVEGTVATSLTACKQRCIDHGGCMAIQYRTSEMDNGLNCFIFDNQDDTAAQEQNFHMYKLNGEVTYMLMPTGTTVCQEDKRVLSAAECQLAFDYIRAENSLTPGRVLQNGAWNGVPIDCSTQYTADQAAHWNTVTFTDNTRVTSGEFRIICKAHGLCKHASSIITCDEGYILKTSNTAYCADATCRESDKSVCCKALDTPYCVSDMHDPHRFRVTDRASSCSDAGWSQRLVFYASDTHSGLEYCVSHKEDHDRFRVTQSTECADNDWVQEFVFYASDTEAPGLTAYCVSDSSSGVERSRLTKGSSCADSSGGWTETFVFYASDHWQAHGPPASGTLTFTSGNTKTTSDHGAYCVTTDGGSTEPPYTQTGTGKTWGQCAFDMQSNSKRYFNYWHTDGRCRVLDTCPFHYDCATRHCSEYDDSVRTYTREDDPLVQIGPDLWAPYSMSLLPANQAAGLGPDVEQEGAAVLSIGMSNSGSLNVCYDCRAPAKVGPILVVYLTWSGASPTTPHKTVAEIREMIYGNIGVANLLNFASWGQTTLDPDMVDILQIASDVDPRDVELAQTVDKVVRQQAYRDWKNSIQKSYHLEFIVLPGLDGDGGDFQATGFYDGLFSRYKGTAIAWQTMLHEMGHNWGVSHAGGYAAPSTYSWQEYADDALMGLQRTSRDGDFTVVARYNLGWIPENQIASFPHDTKVTIRALNEGLGTDGKKLMMRIPCPSCKDHNGDRGGDLFLSFRVADPDHAYGVGLENYCREKVLSGSGRVLTLTDRVHVHFQKWESRVTELWSSISALAGETEFNPPDSNIFIKVCQTVTATGETEYAVVSVSGMCAAHAANLCNDVAGTGCAEVTAFPAEPGTGWCQDASGDQGARRLFSGNQCPAVESMCLADVNCVAYACAGDTSQSIVYTTTGCTQSCDITSWIANPDLIIRANWDGVATDYENAQCNVKTPTPAPTIAPAERYDCTRNQKYMSEATPEDMPESVTSGVHSRSQCAARCDDTPGCKVYIHNKHGGCYLKTQWRTTVNDDLVHETVSCYKAQLYHCARNQNYMSGATPEDMPESVTSGINSQSQCAARCDNTPGCKVYVYNRHGVCYLKTQWRTTVNDDVFHETVSCNKASLLPMTDAGQCAANAQCGECAGDCDTDDQCTPGLVCFTRDATQLVPGCAAGGAGDISANGYCYRPIKATAFSQMPGSGLCLDAYGGETARRVLSAQSCTTVESTCLADFNCVAFACTDDTKPSILYTTTDCAASCTVLSWILNPNLIIRADSASSVGSDSDYQNAQCKVKQATVFFTMPGSGWCQDAYGIETTARRALTGQACIAVESMCFADANCVAYACTDNTKPSILYTSTDCQHSCDVTSWIGNPNLIRQAGWDGVDTDYQNAHCKVKAPTGAPMPAPQWELPSTPAPPGGWYDSGANVDCSAKCTSLGLVCTNSELHAHDAEVATTAKLLAMIRAFGGTTTATDCPQGDNDLPYARWSSSTCRIPVALNPVSNTNCATIEAGFHRPCWCHQLTPTPFPTPTTPTLDQAFSTMPSNGACADAYGGQSTARRFVSNQECTNVGLMCLADFHCVAYACKDNTIDSILYTTTGCTQSCGVTSWIANPAVITQAASDADHTAYQLAQCKVKVVPTPMPPPACLNVNKIGLDGGNYACDCVSFSDACIAAGTCPAEPNCPAMHGQAQVCVNVNQNPTAGGTYNCACVLPTDACFAAGTCHIDANCPAMNGQVQACVNVNQINTAPGTITCECVVPTNPCIAAGTCHVDANCPAMNGQAQACVNVNRITSNPGFFSCACVYPTDPCIADGSCQEESGCPGVNGQQSCVNVNYIHDKPGFFTCDCVSPTSACIADGRCVKEAGCPQSNGQRQVSYTTPCLDARTPNCGFNKCNPAQTLCGECRSDDYVLFAGWCQEKQLCTSARPTICDPGYVIKRPNTARCAGMICQASDKETCCEAYKNPGAYVCAPLKQFVNPRGRIFDILTNDQETCETQCNTYPECVGFFTYQNSFPGYCRLMKLEFTTFLGTESGTHLVCKKPSQALGQCKNSGSIISCDAGYKLTTDRHKVCLGAPGENCTASVSDKNACCEALERCGKRPQVIACSPGYKLHKKEYCDGPVCKKEDKNRCCKATCASWTCKQDSMLNPAKLFEVSPTHELCCQARMKCKDAATLGSSTVCGRDLFLKENSVALCAGTKCTTNDAGICCEAPATETEEAVKKGSLEIPVKGTSGFKTGRHILIKSPNGTEANVVAGFGSIKLVYPLVYDHPPGATIQQLPAHDYRIRVATSAAEVHIKGEETARSTELTWPNPFDKTAVGAFLKQFMQHLQCTACEVALHLDNGCPTEYMRIRTPMFCWDCEEWLKEACEALEKEKEKLKEENNTDGASFSWAWFHNHFHENKTDGETTITTTTG